MAKGQVAVLDISSSKITCMIAEPGVNHTFNIKGSGEVEYAGFKDGKFLEPEKVKQVIALAISNATSMAHVAVHELYVGVPAEFSAVNCREVNINFSKRKRITSAEINQLYYVGNVFRNNPTHSVINISPIYYTLDDSRRIIDPRGIATSKLGGFLSYVLAENNFLDFIEGIVKELGIRRVEFVSVPLAECLFLFEPEVRDRYALLVDCGHICTSVLLTRGDGLLFLNSFSVAGGHISGDLSNVLRISFNEAESLKRKVVLSLNATDSDYYEVSGKDFIVPFPAKVTNEIVMARLDMIADLISKCYARCEYDFPDYIPLYVTGGGIATIRGAKDYLQKRIGRKVEIIAPSLPQLARPTLSSTFSLLDLAFKESSNTTNVNFGNR